MAATRLPEISTAPSRMGGWATGQTTFARSSHPRGGRRPGEAESGIWELGPLRSGLVACHLEIAGMARNSGLNSPVRVPGQSGQASAFCRVRLVRAATLCLRALYLLWR